MNKQIEKMARDIRIVETEYLVAMVTADIDDAIDGAAPRDERIATALYEKGYRKTEDIAREIFEEIDKLFNSRMLYDGTKFFIPHYLEELKDDITELKKKYESEGGKR